MPQVNKTVKMRSARMNLLWMCSIFGLKISSQPRVSMQIQTSTGGMAFVRTSVCKWVGLWKWRIILKRRERNAGEGNIPKWYLQLTSAFVCKRERSHRNFHRGITANIASYCKCVVSTRSQVANRLPDFAENGGRGKCSEGVLEILGKM